MKLCALRQIVDQFSHGLNTRFRSWHTSLENYLFLCVLIFLPQCHFHHISNGLCLITLHCMMEITFSLFLDSNDWFTFYIYFNSFCIICKKLQHYWKWLTKKNCLVFFFPFGTQPLWKWQIISRQMIFVHLTLCLNNYSF